ncbi:unnamed protein product [Brugia timori]|uniref:Sec2p domain-containing protein n=1 Tax=Brugia timori TaxID=42155 RepID=A0A0R3QW68_9BILA|nr:unnamed protein product [Brugia timori]
MFAGNYEQSVDQIVRLEKELRHSIAEKEAKYTRLSELQNHIDSEVQELTEKLFQEAYRMVNDAESRRAKAEKLLLKVYMLVAEVEALKVIVMSPVSSSSSQVTHISQRTGLALRFLGSTLVIVENDLVVEIKGERHSSASSYKIYTLLSFGWDSTPTRQSEKHEPVSEIDPIYHRELTQWRKRGASGDDSSPFLSRIIAEDLTEQVLNAIKANTLELEAVSKTKPDAKTCALSMVPRFCPYKMRNFFESFFGILSFLFQIAVVCDFFIYIRYVNQGIVKCGVHDSYWHIITLRKKHDTGKAWSKFHSQNWRFTSRGFISMKQND